MFEPYIGHILLLRAIDTIGHDLLQFKVMMKQLASASIPAWWLLTLLVLPPHIAPLILACAFVVASLF
jgi:hypothetical protein